MLRGPVHNAAPGRRSQFLLARVMACVDFHSSFSDMAMYDSPLEPLLASTTKGTTKGRSRRRIKLLSFTTLFPNAAQPIHGIFVENRLRQLAATGAVEVRVLAPV